MFTWLSAGMFGLDSATKMVILAFILFGTEDWFLRQLEETLFQILQAVKDVKQIVCVDDCVDVNTAEVHLSFIT